MNARRLRLACWRLREAADRIEALEERLEINHAYQLIDGKMQRVEVRLDESCDGIAARDETIRQQDKNNDYLRKRIEALEAGLRKVLRRVSMSVLLRDEIDALLKKEATDDRA